MAFLMISPITCISSSCWNLVLWDTIIRPRKGRRAAADAEKNEQLLHIQWRRLDLIPIRECLVYLAVRSKHHLPVLGFAFQCDLDKQAVTGFNLIHLNDSELSKTISDSLLDQRRQILFIQGHLNHKEITIYCVASRMGHIS